MPSGAELQAAFAAALHPGGERRGASLPCGLASAGGVAPAKRFAVHRNNVAVGLTEALGATFPAVRRLVGDEYFAALAQAFVAASPPRSPVLLEYGAAFPGFLDGFAPLAAYPYLGDVARLEWAWLRAFHAADAPALEAVHLGAVAAEDLPSLRLTLHPAAHIVSSPWPVLALFSANREERACQPDLIQSGEDVLVSRPRLDVLATRLRPGAFAFVAALASGLALGAACEPAYAAAPDFDLGAVLRDLLEAGAFHDLVNSAGP